MPPGQRPERLADIADQVQEWAVETWRKGLRAVLYGANPVQPPTDHTAQTAS